MNLDELMKAAPNISPEKLAFLNTFANLPAGNNSAAMMRQLANCQRQAKEQNIQFSQNEQDLMIQLLTANLAPAEKAKVEQVLTLLRMRR